MSVDYIFKMNLVPRGNLKLSSVDILKTFIQCGWDLYSENNQVIYTDVGDNDDFNFMAKHISEAEYFEIVQQKEKNKEIIVFSLFYLEGNCRYRIDVTITPEFEVLVSPDDETKKMLVSHQNILDVKELSQN